MARFWFSSEKEIQDKRLEKLRETLRKYPRPFRVEYFVDHLIVRDGNSSECYRMAMQVAEALNLVAESDSEDTNG